MQFLIDQLLSKRHFLAIATLLLGSVVIWGMQYSEIDATFQSILAEDDPYKAEVDQAKLDFPPSTSVLFAFQTETDVFNFKTLNAIEELTLRYDEIEAAISVASLLNYRLNPSDQDTYDRDYLVPVLDGLSSADLEAIKAIALADEDLTKNLLAPEGDMTLAQVKYKAPTDDQDTRLSIAESVITLRDSLRAKYPEVQIYVLGGVLFERDSYNAQIKDSKYLFPLVVTISILLLWFCLRSLSFSLCLFTIAFATIGLSVGTFGWAGIAFNQISSLGPLVVLVIAIADGIHIVSIYVQGLHKNLPKLEAMRQSLAVNIQPVTLATVTTAMGFPKLELLLFAGDLWVRKYCCHWRLLGISRYTHTPTRSDIIVTYQKGTEAVRC